MINKEKVKSRSHKRYAVAEKTIFKLIQHQFIIQWHACFETDIYLFFVLEYCTGKALSSYLDEEGWFDEAKSKFYIWEWVAAINALHKKGIMYRDLKPNNIMLDGQGHIKLIDFNLSKSGFESNHTRTSSFWGSYAYMPPEIINHKSYSKSVDWYLVGILLYEMLTGFPPYFSKNSKMIQKNIVNNKLEIPKDLTPEWRNLLKLLLNKDSTKRIGIVEGANEILSHPWFEGITLEEIEALKLNPYKAYLKETPSEILDSIDSKLKRKMKEINLKFQKQISNYTMVLIN